MTRRSVAQPGRLAPHRAPVDARRGAGSGRPRTSEQVRPTTDVRAPGPCPGPGGVPARSWASASAIARAFSHGVRPPRPGILPSIRQGADHARDRRTVIIIGGAEDKVRDRVILSRFATLAGGRDATVVVISTASSLGARGRRALQAGLRRARRRARSGRIHAVTRAQANDETAALAIRDATGIFLTGGNQLRLSSTIGGTRLADAVLDQFRQGAVVAGTSAGRVGDVAAT